ncbi:hypothetical protein TPDSL_03170 [Terrisporobacter petrolearius]|uniref:DNA-3-methyladenine glycosylase family protein n=1 Tax=Terrisporobacter petrolearius TaxID=1460447 RepID=UPI0033669A36
MPNAITLNEQSEAIQYLCKKDKRLAKVISMVGPITYETHDEPFAFLIHEIIEQMLSIKAGAKIYGRLEELCNGSITPKNISLLSDEQIKSIGISSSKVFYIRGVAAAVLSKKIIFEEFDAMSEQAICKKLLSLKGVGYWTVKMYLIFVLDKQDILPTEDIAFIQAYEWMYKTTDRSKESIEKRCKKWKPYSSIAARYLYRALDAGFTKKEFHLFK